MSARLLALALSAVCLVAFLPATTSARGLGRWDRYLAPAGHCKNDDQTGLSLRQERATMVCLVNYARTARGLRRLRSSPLLQRVAQAKLRDIHVCRYYSHVPCTTRDNARCRQVYGRPCRTSFMSYYWAAGYLSSRYKIYQVGENLDYGADESGQPRPIMLQWLESDEHRQTLFTASYKDLGVGFGRGAGWLPSWVPVARWTTDFGVRS